jgi:outer membrane lipoprotein-sorting protein
MTMRNTASVFLLLLIASFSISSALEENMISKAINAFDSLQSYSVTLKTLCCESDEEINYAFKKPGFIRMDFINPHEGAILAYNPQTKKVRVKPSGLFSFIKLTLNPDNGLIKSPKGRQVDESDIGSLLSKMDTLLFAGIGEVTSEEILNSRPCYVYEINGVKNFTVDDINKYKVWLDKELNLPLKVEAFDTLDVLIESVLMDNLQINTTFEEDFFD